MKLSVIIVNYNVKYYLEQCLNSILRARKDDEISIHVVDNHSKDDSKTYLMSRFPSVNFYFLQHNVGFAKANNLVLRQDESDYVLLINPDTIVGETLFEQLFRFIASHSGIGAVGVRMLKADGSSALESRRGVPTPLTAFYKMCGLTSRFPTNRRFARYYMGHLLWNEPSRIEIVSGAFFLLRREALTQVGFLDEDFFMYGEDIDLSYRLLKAGYENWYLPVPILHYKGESTHKTSFRYVHVFYEAMLIFFRKHYGNAFFFITIPIKLAIYAKALVALMSILVERSKKALGLFKQKKPPRAEFIFIGSRQMLDECADIARKNALNASYMECNEDTFDVKLLEEKYAVAPEKGIIFVTYDTETFSYDFIFQQLSAHPRKRVELGTYSVKTKVLITPYDTFS